MRQHPFLDDRRRIAGRFRGTRAFSFVEILLAATIGVGVIVTAVYAYDAASRARGQSFGAITLPGSVFTRFYGGTGTNVQIETYIAPNYGRVAAADSLRDTFINDLHHATAVFCLSRANSTATPVRPTALTITTSNFDARACSTSDDFRQLLINCGVTTASTTFSSGFRGPAPGQNLSIFILQKSDSITTISIRAIYEVDFVATNDSYGRSGTYASVRRYDNYSATNQAPTDYYDIFYPDADDVSRNVAFTPVAVQFERAARLAVTEAAYDKYKVADNRPFYFVWWPDPAARYLASATTASYSSSDVRYAYQGMANRTAYFMVVPMFPAL